MPDGYKIADFKTGKWLTLRKGQDAAILAAGTMTAAALRVTDALAEEGMDIEVINASTIKPMDDACLKAVFDRNIPVFTIEEHVLQGGFGSAVLEAAAMMGKQTQIIPLAVEDRFVQHGDHKHLLEEVGLDDASIADRIRNIMKEKAESQHG